MKLSDDNKEALVSSLIVGMAFGLFFGALVHFYGTTTTNAYVVGVIFAIIGTLNGLLLTWDFEEIEDDAS